MTKTLTVNDPKGGKLNVSVLGTFINSMPNVSSANFLYTYNLNQLDYLHSQFLYSVS